MRLATLTFAVLATVTLLHSLTAEAQLIDFEATPGGGTPADDTPIPAYNLTGGGTVSFYFDTNLNNTFDSGIDGDAIYEAAGMDGTDAFANGGLGVPDTAATPALATQLGSYFARALVPFAVPDPFIIDYNTTQTISALSGEIWDIDGQPQGTELWQVDVLDSSATILASQTSPLGNSLALDGRPWTFAFSGLPSGVDKVRLTFLGTKPAGVGLAFNNFNPTVPEPSTWAMLCAGLGAIGLKRLLQRQRGTRRGHFRT